MHIQYIHIWPIEVNISMLLSIEISKYAIQQQADMKTNEKYKAKTTES